MLRAKLGKIAYTSACLLLVCSLVFSSFFNVRKAEAFVPVAAGAYAAAAALAAELGISVEALMGGLVVVTAAGTGVYLMSSSDGTTLTDPEWRNLWGDQSNISNPGYESNWSQDYQKWKLGNGKSWEELTNEEKANWANPAEYVQSQWLGYLLQTGLIEQSQNGGFEPTPEPDPEEDPDGYSRWHESRNVLTVLGVGAAAVALNEGVGWLADTMAQGIKDLLFNTGSGGLGLIYSSNATVENTQVQFGIADINKEVTYRSITYAMTAQTWSGCTVTGGRYYYLAPKKNQPVNNYLLTLNNSNNNYTYWSGNPNGTSTPEIQIIYNSNGSYYNTGGVYSGGGSPFSYANTATSYGFLNALFIGTYLFANGATYNNGRFSDDTGVSQSTTYGQIADTPANISNSVLNDDDWANNVSLNTSDAEEGYTNAIAIPQDWSNVSSYNDLVKPVPNEQIVTIPNDEPVNPNPVNPNPPVNNYQESFSEQVGRLLAQPFNQLFPFCLIGDLQVLLDKIKVAVYPQQTRDITIVNGTSDLTISLDEFGGPFEDIDFEMDLTPINDLAYFVRPFMTSLFIIGLLVGTFRFFLNRGGE